MENLTPWEMLIKEVKEGLTTLHIPYCFIGTTALYLHGMKQWNEFTIEVCIQWDQFQSAFESFSEFQHSQIENRDQTSVFFLYKDKYEVRVSCLYNFVVSTDPHRSEARYLDDYFYIKSLESFLDPIQPSPYKDHVIHFLRQQQDKVNQHNRTAWTTGAFDAWVNRFGEPEVVAQKIIKQPESFLGPLLTYFNHLSGKKVMNLLGSNGLKALALASLGAKASVVDISEGNARYAQAVAQNSNLKLNYIVADCLELPEAAITHDYDYVLMEKGILHYFLYLPDLFHVVTDLLKPGGTLILEDFHPVSTKLIQSSGKKHKVNGNYFDHSLKKVRVAIGKHLTHDHGETEPFVFEKYWTLGEIVTAVGQCGLMVTTLYEQPNMKKDDQGLPKTFTLLAQKV